MGTMPNDPVILLSYINTQLRDHYASLSELCKATGANESEIMAKMAFISYEYNAELNKFV